MTNNYAGSYSFRATFQDIDIPRIMKDVPETCNIVQIQVGEQVLFAARASIRKLARDAGVEVKTLLGVTSKVIISSHHYPVVNADGSFTMNSGTPTGDKWYFCSRKVGEEARNQMDIYIDWMKRIEEHYKKLNRVVVRYYSPESVEIKPIIRNIKFPTKEFEIGDKVRIKDSGPDEFTITSLSNDYCTIDQPSCYEEGDGDTICRLSNLERV